MELAINSNSKFNAIVADDEKFVRRNFKQRLERLDYHVDEAENGHDVIEYFKKGENQYCLVIMDLMMPGMDGIEATEKIKKMFKDVLIIAVTNHEPERLIEAIKVGACHGITKDQIRKNPEFFTMLHDLVNGCNKFSWICNHSYLKGVQ